MLYQFTSVGELGLGTNDPGRNCVDILTDKTVYLVMIDIGSALAERWDRGRWRHILEAL